MKDLLKLFGPVFDPESLRGLNCAVARVQAGQGSRDTIHERVVATLEFASSIQSEDEV